MARTMYATCHKIIHISHLYKTAVFICCLLVSAYGSKDLAYIFLMFLKNFENRENKNSQVLHRVLWAYEYYL